MRPAALALAGFLGLATPAAAQLGGGENPASAALGRWEASSGVGVAPDLRDRLIAQTAKTLDKPDAAPLLGPDEKAEAVDKAIADYLSKPTADVRAPQRYRQVLGQTLEIRNAALARDHGLTGAPGPVGSSGGYDNAGGGGGGGASGDKSLWDYLWPFNPPITQTWTLVLEAAPDALDFKINDQPLARSAKDQYLVMQTTARVLLKAASGFVCKVDVKRDGGDRTAHCRQP